MDNYEDILTSEHDIIVEVYSNELKLIYGVPCQNDDCKVEGTQVLLREVDRGKWKTCDGYMDPEKDFQEPKKFSRRITQWAGTCIKCGSNYRGMMRVSEEE